MRNNALLLSFLLIVFCSSVKAQSKVKKLTLDDATKIAVDSSLASFRIKNMYYAGFWEFRAYLAQRKPFLEFRSVVTDYNRAFIQRYNPIIDADEYRNLRNTFSSFNLSLNQNLPLTGGTLFLDSDIARLQNFGERSFTQYTTIPFRVGLVQPIFAHNEFKWQRKIEPLKFERAKKDFVQSIEEISFETVHFFFDYLIANARWVMARENLANADTLYNIGKKKMELASLLQSDVLTLKVDMLNAKSNLTEVENILKQASINFQSFLRMNNDYPIELVIPDKLPVFAVGYEEALTLAERNNPLVLALQQQVLESQKNVDKVGRDRYSANLILSYGLNQQGPLLPLAYQSPLNHQQAMVGLSFPILDWGMRRGRYNMAQRQLEVTNVEVEQRMIDFRNELYMAVLNFNAQIEVVVNYKEAKEVANQVYELTKQKFINGKSDANSLGIALQRKDQANLNYLKALHNYWSYYHNLRRLTMYDFENMQPVERYVDHLLEYQ
jgi:hypothetical protein